MEYVLDAHIRIDQAKTMQIAELTENSYFFSKDFFQINVQKITASVLYYK